MANGRDLLHTGRSDDSNIIFFKPRRTPPDSCRVFPSTNIVFQSFGNIETIFASIQNKIYVPYSTEPYSLYIYIYIYTNKTIRRRWRSLYFSKTKE